MLTIEKGLPIPPAQTGKSSAVHIPFREMEVGDSVLVPHDLVARVKINYRVKDANKRLPGHWVTRLEGNATRVYKDSDQNQTARSTSDLA